MITATIVQLGKPNVKRTFTAADVQAMMRDAHSKQKPLPIRDKKGRLWDAPNVPSQMSGEEYGRLCGGYIIPSAFMRELLKIDAYWKRREHKMKRRYQHQKRKQ